MPKMTENSAYGGEKMTKTVLIVDDDPSQRRLLQAAVERQGFATRMAEDGAQAVA